MRHHIFQPSERYPIAILIKATSFNKQELQNNYLDYLSQKGIPASDTIAFTLEHSAKGKVSVKDAKAYLDTLLPVLDGQGVNYLYVADTAYFKVLTRQTKADPHHGYQLPCKIAGYEHLIVILGVNYHALIYNPALQEKLNVSLDTLASVVHGNYVAPGTGIIHLAHYPRGEQEIATALESLHQYAELTCDIEAFSLRFNEAGIGTMAFAWDQHNGMAFLCDYLPSTNIVSQYEDCGIRSSNGRVHQLIKQFLETYKGTITWHNAAYDVKVLIYTLWMKDPLDTEGLLEGLEVMTRSIDDTKIIAYLATNSTAGNVLGLKALAQDFAGNWAKEDIKDIRRLPQKELLQYNLVDALSTWYVKNTFTPIMIQDKQQTIYTELMLPSLKLLLQTELTGMPMNQTMIAKVKDMMVEHQRKHYLAIVKSPIIKVLNLLLQTQAMKAANAKLKVKQHPLNKFEGTAFNPNSNPQLQQLLYEQMGLPVIDLTDTKMPATGADTIEKLIHHTSSPEYKQILTSLIEYGKVTKILSTFIPAFERGMMKADGMIYLHGSFNIGGTVSGRLSSSSPNLQNIPAGSQYAEWIKWCFMAASGWLFCGADFNSLEDMISALTTKDPNKLKVYVDGFDGHSLRAYSYFPEELPGISNTVASINSIKKAFPDQRQASKAPTFLLTYGGTYHGLKSNLGWDEDKAKQIEANYHELYKVSDQYVQDRLKQASSDGYVEVAFGLRVRTPLLKQVVYGSSRMPYAASSEGRTAGNALGQSYGLLNNRAAVAFMKKVWVSKYRLDIKPIALIHDAIYLLIRDNAEVMHWANIELIKAMQWQELPEIQHPTVKLGAALDIFWPDWAHPITIPNGASEDEIREICSSVKSMRAEKENQPEEAVA